MVCAPAFEIVHHLLGSTGIPIAGGANLHSGGPGEHEFGNVGRGRNAAHPDYGNTYRMGCVVDHAQGNRFDGGSRESCSDIRDARLARLGVDGHGYEGIDQRDGIGAGFLCDVRHLRDAGYVGRQLDDQGSLRDALRGGHQFVEGARIVSELQSSVGGVGAGDVQFVGGDAFAVVQNFDGSFVVLAGVAKDVGKNHDVFDLSEPGHLFFEKSRSPDVLQTDGVEHTGCSLPQARRRIADHRFARESFDHEPSQLVEVNDIFKLDAISKGSAGRDDGIFKLDAGEAHAQIESRLAAV